MRVNLFHLLVRFYDFELKTNEFHLRTIDFHLSFLFISVMPMILIFFHFHFHIYILFFLFFLLLLSFILNPLPSSLSNSNMRRTGNVNHFLYAIVGTCTHIAIIVLEIWHFCSVEDSFIRFHYPWSRVHFFFKFFLLYSIFCVIFSC